MQILGAAVLGLLATPALAQFNLQITEMWPGNEPGNNLTEDWFEIVNFGDAAWISGVDGDLYAAIVAMERANGGCAVTS